MVPVTDTATALRLLDWYRAMGVDAAVEPEAIDWLARGGIKPGAAYLIPDRVSEQPIATPLAAPRKLPQVSGTKPETHERREKVTLNAPTVLSPRTFAAPSPDAAVATARAAATAAGTIEELGRTLADFGGCGLKATAKNLCFYRGAAQARLMVVGEAPGREDDLAGAPFSGPAGDLLEKMLAAIGVASADCHITNAVYWRPPGNRHPTPQELDVCQPFLDRQTALVKPQVLVLLGLAAARQVMDIGEGIMRVRGKWRDVTVGGHRVRAIASLAPTYLIKSPSSKQSAWRDMLAIKAALAGETD